MGRCEHRRQVFIPHEDDPSVMVQVCVNCSKVLSIAAPGDAEIEAIGHSLGDPDEED